MNGKGSPSSRVLFKPELSKRESVKEFGLGQCFLGAGTSALPSPVVPLCYSELV